MNLWWTCPLLHAGWWQLKSPAMMTVTGLVEVCFTLFDG
jgi:hypothetical protein